MGLGLSFLFGFSVCFYVIVRKIVYNDVSSAAWMTAAVFALSLFGISWLQNSERYILPLLALLPAPLIAAFSASGGRWWVALALAVCLFNVATMPRFGLGSGPVVVAEAGRGQHAGAYANHLDRQRVADRLSEKYGRHGRILDMSAGATPVGEVFASSWYRSPAAKEIAPFLSRGSRGLDELLHEKNIDAVAVDLNAITRLGADISVLRNVAKQVDSEGSFLVFHTKDEVRFDTFSPLASPPGTHTFGQAVGPGTYAWRIVYRCTAPGQIARIRVAGGTWASRYEIAPLCDGKETELSSPLITSDDHKGTYVIFHGFGPDLEIVKAGLWHRN
jgi:hypothetical protein